MILEDMDFTDFYKHVENIFSEHFSEEDTGRIMYFVNVLSDANFRCYKANMEVIAARKGNNSKAYSVKMGGGGMLVNEKEINELISEMEWVARSVGEYRVASKANINRLISRVKSTKEIVPPNAWVSDDIVYSIGEMMDRLSIETIKREDFRVNNRPDHMTESSQKLSNRVEKYLKSKLVEIDEKGFYECVHEQRTYDLEGIVKDLAI